MTALLASVRNVEEACAAADAGADLIDLKEPRDGALGGVAVADVRIIVQCLRARWRTRPISATIGDLPMAARQDMTARVAAVGATGVDYVKVGIISDGPRAHAPDSAGRLALAHLASLPERTVPVLLCDQGIDVGLVEDAVRYGFPGVMFDTADKSGRTLFDCVDAETLARMIEFVRRSGALTGVAGALRLTDVPAIVALAPDFAGFRTALCSGGRTGVLDAGKVSALRAALREESRVGIAGKLAQVT